MAKIKSGTTQSQSLQIEIVRLALALGAPDLLKDLEGRLGLLLDCLSARGYCVLPNAQPITAQFQPSQVAMLRHALQLGAPDLLAKIEGRLGLLVNCLNASHYRILPDLVGQPVSAGQGE